MMQLPNHIIDEILTAMDDYKAIAQLLINKLITETDQPEKIKIAAGHYYEIQNSTFLNGQESLSENWRFDIHGEHCKFRNIITDQTLEVSLGDKDSIANLDPYFFHRFLESTERY